MNYILDNNNNNYNNNIDNTYLNIHTNIIKKLFFFIEKKTIPHIIFYGPSGSGKRYILNKFLNSIK